MLWGLGQHRPEDIVRRITSNLDASTSDFNGPRFVGRSVRLRKQHQYRHRHQDVQYPVSDDWRSRFMCNTCEQPQYQPHIKVVGTPQSRSVHLPALEPQTYAFYQEMPPESVDEAFLWSRLEPKLDYLRESERAKVQEALFLAYDAHKGQRRKSGEPFISHPVEVTRILAELKSEPDTLVAGLLHDTVEDTDLVSLEEIEMWFGYDCKRIVEGETKFSKLSQLQKPSVSKEDLQALDLQQLFLAMTEDARIIIVKLADRLHNMRTMGSMPPEKQKKIGNETLAMFAPLAGLLGLYSIKTELEDLSMKYCMPGLYTLIESHRNQLIADQESTLLEAKEQLEERLRADVFLTARCEAIDVIHTYRSVYSIYKRVKAEVQKKMPHVPLNGVPLKRMQQLIKGHNVLNEVTEIAQLSVIISEHEASSARSGMFFTSPVQLCYQVLGVLHSMWAPVPGSIKDFISTPKRNGYQGLHTCLLPLGCKSLIPLEVHVRTASMQELAKYGIAADSWSLKSPPAEPAAWQTAPQLISAPPGADRKPRSTSPATVGGGRSGPSLRWPSQPFSRGASLAASREGPANDRAAGGLPPDFDVEKTVKLLQGALQAVRCHNGAGPSSFALDHPSAANGSTASNGSAISASANGNGKGSFTSNGNGAGSASSAQDSFTQLMLEAYTKKGSSGFSAAPHNGSSMGSSPSLALPAARATRADASTPSYQDWGLARHGSSVSGGKLAKDALERRVNWLNSIREWQQEFLGSLTAQEFVQCIREDLLSQTVFVFTPLGDIMRLPMGATVVDFAYHVHSDVGNSMVAAKVNGRPVHPGYELCNADVVEVIRYETVARSHREHAVQRHKVWLNHAKTRSARYKLNKFIKEQAGACEEDTAEVSQEKASLRGDGDSASECTWLVVECEDRAGILAEVATQISLHGLNIQAYSGSTPDQVDMGLVSFMNFQLIGDKSRLSELCDKISKIEAVQSWSVSCSSTPDSITTFDARDPSSSS